MKSVLSNRYRGQKHGTAVAFLILIGGILPWSNLYAGMLVLEGVDSATVTTGDLLDGVRSEGITIESVEIPGLMISARAGDSTQEINVTSSSFGINADGSGDDTDAFDVGESLILSMDHEVRINSFDFNLFDDPSESFQITVPGIDPVEIEYNGLSDQLRGVYDTDLVVPAHTEITFTTASPTPIGIDGIDMDVIPEPAVISLITFVGIGTFAARRIFR